MQGLNKAVCFQVSAGGSLSNSIVGVARLGMANSSLTDSGPLRIGMLSVAGSDAQVSSFPTSSTLADSMTCSCLRDITAAWQLGTSSPALTVNTYSFLRREVSGARIELTHVIDRRPDGKGPAL